MVLIGEGSFGCVYRPPLRCKTKSKITRKKMISKLMTNEEAKEEVDEYELLKRIDPRNMYYLGPPQQCDANPTDVKKTKKDCSLLEENPDTNDYDLLFYKDGGIDLDNFVEEHLEKYLVKNARAQTDKFFFNAHKLFLGIRHYINHAFLHHDIKPSNIVFDPKTYIFNFIDFGLSLTTRTFVRDIIKKRDYESFHWSYPVELGFTKFKKDFHFEKLTNEKIDHVERDFLSYFVNFDNEEDAKKLYKIKLKSYMLTTFRYMNNELEPINVSNMVKRLTMRLKDYVANRDFQTFVNNTVPFMDVYALGFTMNHVLNEFYKKGAIPADHYKLYHTLFSEMFDFDFGKRLVDMNVIMSRYESILDKTGVLSRLRKKFDNHIQLDDSASRRKSMSKMRSTIKNRRRHSILHKALVQSS